MVALIIQNKQALFKSQCHQLHFLGTGVIALQKVTPFRGYLI